MINPATEGRYISIYLSMDHWADGCSAFDFIRIQNTTNVDMTVKVKYLVLLVDMTWLEVILLPWHFAHHYNPPRDKTTSVCGS